MISSRGTRVASFNVYAMPSPSNRSDPPLPYSGSRIAHDNKLEFEKPLYVLDAMTVHDAHCGHGRNTRPG